ncbi:MAG: carbohydrate ABC transporter permease [Anaerolineae bacterium]|nr:carbohydrate ABC transporter permease [Anaerolineae bacterium]
MNPKATNSVHDRDSKNTGLKSNTKVVGWVGHCATYILLIVAGVVTLVPVIWVIISSLRESSAVVAIPLGLPNPPQWSNYTYAWEAGKVRVSFRNSLIITSASTFLVIGASTLAGYSLARLKFFGRTSLFSVFILGLMIPFEAMMVPFYFRMWNFGLLNNPLSVILSFTAFTIPAGTLIMRAFYAEIPQEIEDAARVDGCSEFQLFLWIMLPIAKPGVVSLAIVATVWSWNDFTRPLLLLQNPDARTLPLAIINFQGAYGLIDVAPLFAAAVISFLPILLAYFILQKQFLQGIMSGAIKG